MNKMLVETNLFVLFSFSLSRSLLDIVNDEKQNLSRFTFDKLKKENAWTHFRSTAHFRMNWS